MFQAENIATGVDAGGKAACACAEKNRKNIINEKGLIFTPKTCF